MGFHKGHTGSSMVKREQFPKTQRCFSWSSGSECRSHQSNGQWVTMTMDPLGMFFWVSNTCCGGDGHLHQPGQDSRNNNPPMVFLVLVPFKRFEQLQLYWWIFLLKTIFLRIASAWNMPFTNSATKIRRIGRDFPTNRFRQGMGDDDFDDDGDWQGFGVLGPIFNLGYGYRFQHPRPQKIIFRSQEGIT